MESLLHAFNNYCRLVTFTSKSLKSCTDELPGSKELPQGKIVRIPELPVCKVQRLVCPPFPLRG